ncbi:hypothetical protein BN871_GI_00040 [Paenibacillus sp. P22]|nr:hypothetical protein BN871_GI_00040 [Paenibacillus sp. P22]
MKEIRGKVFGIIGYKAKEGMPESKLRGRKDAKKPVLEDRLELELGAY